MQDKLFQGKDFEKAPKQKYIEVNVTKKDEISKQSLDRFWVFSDINPGPGSSKYSEYDVRDSYYVCFQWVEFFKYFWIFTLYYYGIVSFSILYFALTPQEMRNLFLMGGNRYVLMNQCWGNLGLAANIVQYYRTETLGTGLPMEGAHLLVACFCISWVQALKYSYYSKEAMTKFKTEDNYEFYVNKSIFTFSWRVTNRQLLKYLNDSKKRNEVIINDYKMKFIKNEQLIENEFQKIGQEYSIENQKEGYIHNDIFLIYLDRNITEFELFKPKTFLKVLSVIGAIFLTLYPILHDVFNDIDAYDNSSDAVICYNVFMVLAKTTFIPFLFEFLVSSIIIMRKVQLICQQLIYAIAIGRPDSLKRTRRFTHPCDFTDLDTLEGWHSAAATTIDYYQESLSRSFNLGLGAIILSIGFSALLYLSYYVLDGFIEEFVMMTALIGFFLLQVCLILKIGEIINSVYDLYDTQIEENIARLNEISRIVKQEDVNTLKHLQALSKQESTFIIHGGIPPTDQLILQQILAKEEEVNVEKILERIEDIVKAHEDTKGKLEHDRKIFTLKWMGIALGPEFTSTFVGLATILMTALVTEAWTRA